MFEYIYTILKKIFLGQKTNDRKKIEKAKKKNSRGIIISYHPRKIQRKNRIK